jgi:raffinose synthase
MLPGRPCRDCLFKDVCGDGVSVLKVWNLNACGGLLALFNVQVRGETRLVGTACSRMCVGMV